MSDTSTASSRRPPLRRLVLVASAAFATALGVYVFWQHGLRLWIEESAPSRIVEAAGAVWIFTGAGFYAWRRVSLRRLRAKTHARFDDIVSQTIGTAAVTLEWAVRAEMVRDDVQDVREYMQQLAKRPGVLRALVAKTDGAVIAASDSTGSPANLGEPLADAVPELPPESSQVQVLARPDGVLRLVIPIMGLEARLGTMVVEYERPVL